MVFFCGCVYWWEGEKYGRKGVKFRENCMLYSIWEKNFGKRGGKGKELN